MPDTPAAAQTRIFDQYADDRGVPAETPPKATPERDPKTGLFLKRGITARLVAQARQLGIDDDELQEMDAADLRAELRDRAFDSKIDKLFDVRETARRAAQPAKVEPVPEAYVSTLDDTNCTDAIRQEFAHLRRELEELRKENASLKEKVGGVDQFVQGQTQREARSFVRRVDALFAKYPDIFGVGGADKLDPESVEMDMRKSAVKFHNQKGGDPDDLEANVEAFAGRFAAKAPEPPTDEEAEWDQGVYGTPTQAGPREAAPSREKAVQSVRAKLAGVSPKPSRGIYLKHNRSQANGEG